MLHFIDSAIPHILVESPPCTAQLSQRGVILQESGHACPTVLVCCYTLKGILFEGWGYKERTTRNQPEPIRDPSEAPTPERHCGERKTREKEASFLNLDPELQALLPVRILGLF